MYQLMNKDMKKVVDDVVATAVLPHFFTHDRLAAIRDVFEVMDADDELTLDLNEISPFYHYSFVKLFGISLTKDQTEALFHLMDTDGGSEVVLLLWHQLFSHFLIVHFCFVCAYILLDGVSFHLYILPPHSFILSQLGCAEFLM